MWNGALYQVVSQSLIKITNTDTGAFSTIGTVAGTEIVETAVGFNTAVIVVKGSSGAIYTLDKSDVLATISGNSNFVACTDVAHINGRFVYIPFDGDPAFFSDVGAAGTVQVLSFFDAEELPDLNNSVFNYKNTLYIGGTDSFELFRDTGASPNPFGRVSGAPAFFSDVGAAGTVQVLSFFDAEELPDLNNSVFNYKNTLYIGGTDSFELFRDTGASPNPFGRVSGARITNGYIGGLIEYNETFLFIGREKDQDFGIYAIGQGTAPKLSNETIDLVLSTYSQAELAAAIGGRIKWRGYDIATFRLARDSFGFFAGNWFPLDTVIGGISKPWSGGFITQFEGSYYSAFEGKIGVFARVNTDYGSRITRIVDTAFEQEDNDRFSCQSIQLGISQGFSSTTGSVALFMSKDNVTYGQPLYRDLGAVGKYADHLEWNYAGGMGSYHGFMGVRIYTTEDVEFLANSLIANLR